ncbi:5717_t:CDS:2 [Diversispora eburnea]|uniref:5717_t:CDS:1 n=1 Tax=Diversispora eburnea TaxID=1213867 RepID=A0A9N9FSI4_9GLOM|nr:5717_t:CDS:2 [Diversispora eburnea]
MPKTIASPSSLRDSKDFRLVLKNAIKKHLDAIKSQGVNLKTNLPLEELLAPSKKTLKKGKKRAQNGFILYRKDNQSKVQKEHPFFSQPEISKILQERWSVEPSEIKNVYTILKFNFSIPHIPNETPSLTPSSQNSYIPPAFTQFLCDNLDVNSSQCFQYEQDGNWQL